MRVTKTSEGENKFDIKIKDIFLKIYGIYLPKPADTTRQVLSKPLGAV